VGSVLKRLRPEIIVAGLKAVKMKGFALLRRGFTESFARLDQVMFI
jgi:hypothetical protein